MKKRRTEIFLKVIELLLRLNSGNVQKVVGLDTGLVFSSPVGALVVTGDRR
jgi:hypothetical protein